MAYVSSMERYGIQKGLAQGLALGEQRGELRGETQFLLLQLDRKFGQITDDYRHRIATADSDTLLKWGVQLLDAKTIEEVFA